MNVLYVKIKDKIKNNNKIMEKVKEVIKKIFLIIDLEEIFNGYIAKIPLEDNKKIKNLLVSIKLRKIIKEKNIDGIVLADNIKENQDFVDKLILKKNNKKSNRFFENIISKIKDERRIFFFEGKSLFKYIIYDILVYIINIQQRKPELEDVYIIVNNIDENMLNNIEFLSTKFKNINIVTKNIEKYQYIEELVYNNTGNNVVLLNSKKKSLKRAKYIINVDNSIEELKKYSIYRKAIIINMQYIIEQNIIKNEKTTNNKVSLQAFEGIFVNSFDINLNEKTKEFFKKYELINITSLVILYESFLNKRENFWNIRAKIEDAGLIVTKLYGNNGIINESEYKRVNIDDNKAKKL